ncbi:hypothetical protein HDU93_007771 [Gonapodya sp. JEL0774]|nr:hypothetical protein HDU93_007771 [Gonapodya sp. JEL0774]
MFLPPPIPEPQNEAEADVPAIADLTGLPVRSTPSLSVFAGSRVAVFGACSCAGAAIARRLLSLDVAELHLVEREGAELQGETVRDKKVKVYRWKEVDDIARMDDLAGKNIQYVVNAALLMDEWERLEHYRTFNLELPRNIMRLSENFRTVGTLKRIAHISTTDIYGYALDAAGTDETKDPRDANLGPQTTACYGELVVHHGIERGLPITIFRTPNLYGPLSSSSSRIIGLVERGAMITIGNGLNDVGLVYVDDLADGVLAACLEPTATGRVFNMWAREPVTWREYLDLISDNVGAPRVQKAWSGWFAALVAWWLELLFWIFGWYENGARPWLTAQEVSYWRYDRNFSSERARIVFGWMPKVTASEGVKRTVKWYRDSQIGTGSDSKKQR